MGERNLLFGPLPTTSPTDTPTYAPTYAPTGAPAYVSPTKSPTERPPTKSPTDSPTKNPTKSPIYTGLKPLGSIFVETSDCVLDVPIMFDVPGFNVKTVAVTDLPKYVWGFRFQIKDQTLGGVITRYVPLYDVWCKAAKSPTPDCMYRSVYFVVCYDEVTGTQNPAAPTKPYGSGKYWSMTTEPIPGGLSSQSAYFAPWKYETNYILNIAAVHVTGYVYPSKDSAIALSGDAKGCAGGGLDMDECCTNNGKLPVGLDCDGEDGDDLWQTTTCAANMYDPPKYYSSQAKTGCGWLETFPTAPADPSKVPSRRVLSETSRSLKSQSAMAYQ